MRAVTGLRAVPHLRGRRIDLRWRNPSAAEFAGPSPFAGIRIVRRERMFPLSAEDGDLVYEGPVVDAFADTGVRSLATYYYTVYARDSSLPVTYYAEDGSQAAAFATEDYGLTERWYRLLPAAHQRYDTPLSPVERAALPPAVLAALDALPPPLRGQGPLRRFFTAAAAPLDLMRSMAEGLRDLHDVDRARPEFLLPLARWVGWELDRTLPVYAQRSEIKGAPRLYRGVGTVPSLRALVTRYTGWHTQVAEFVQHLVRSNTPPQLQLFAMAETTGVWRGTDDAAPILGFGAGNDLATGSPGTTAFLVGTTASPFPLRPGIELAITADDRLPVAVRFQPGDFVDIAAATAAEVAGVLNRTLSEVTATAMGTGQIEIRGHRPGPEASLRVERYETSLASLEGAPRGRLAVFRDLQARLRLFYETADPLAPVTTETALRELRGIPAPTGLLPGEDPPEPLPAAAAAAARFPSEPQGRIRYKTFRGGTWGESLPLAAAPGAAMGEPAAVTLADGRIWIAWAEAPHTGSARLRFTTGTPRLPRPARLEGRRRGPFAIRPGDRLLLRGQWPGAESLEFAASDFATPSSATPAEVAAAVNTRLTRVSATVNVIQNTLILQTLAAGGEARLVIGPHTSTAAAALGFDAGNDTAAGDWGDGIDWQPAQDIPAGAPGRHADLHAVVDGTGGVRLFWATHEASEWRIVTSRWDGVTWSPRETLADGPGGSREPCAVLDAANRVWLFWARRTGAGTSEDEWTLRRRVFDPVPAAWGAEAPVTTPPAVGRAADREPGVVRLAGGDLRIFFRSDRAGGPDLWSVTIAPPAGAPSAPAQITAGAPGDHAPAPVLRPDGSLWLLYRSDRSVSLSRVATHPLPEVDARIGALPPAAGSASTELPRSVRAPDIGSLRRFAGATSVVVGDAARLGRRRQWDDLLCYTPQRPLAPLQGEALKDDELYSPGTVGLYLSPVIPDSPLTRQRVERLRPVLEQFLPIHARAVVILAPRAEIELVYPPGADIGEKYLDKYPVVEFYTGLGDSTAVLPDWVLFLSATLDNLPGDHVSADPAAPTTLRFRTYAPPAK